MKLIIKKKLTLNLTLIELENKNQRLQNLSSLKYIIILFIRTVLNVV